MANKIAVLDCSGTHHSMGLAQGRAYRDSLRRLDSALQEISGLDQRGALGAALARVGPPIADVAGRVGSRLMARDLADNYPDQYDRLVGIAEGAEIPLHRLFLGPALELLLNRVSYRMPGACTAMAVTASKSAGGEPMIAKNFDYPAIGSHLYLMRRSRPAGLAASIDVTNVPISGSHEGVNSHGLALAYNYGYLRGSAKARVTITNLIQEMLELCHDVEEAIEYLRGRPRSGGALLMAADASGAIAAIELSPDRLAIRRGGDHGDWLAHTNHAMTREMKSADIPEDAVFSRWNPKQVRGLPVQISSRKRLDRAAELLELGSGLTEDDLATMLADHDGGSAGDDNTICRHGPFYTTTCSVLLFPRRRALKVMFGPPCEHEFTDVYPSDRADPGRKTSMAKFSGTVQKNDLEGGFWELHASDGERYQLRGGDDALRVEGINVDIVGKVDKGGFGIGMSGPILQVSSWTAR